MGVKPYGTLAFKDYVGQGGFRTNHNRRTKDEAVRYDQWVITVTVASILIGITDQMG